MWACCFKVVLLVVALHCARCRETMADSHAPGYGVGMGPFEQWIRRNRRGTSSNCCTEKDIDNLQDEIQDDLNDIIQVVSDIGFQLQEFINLGQSTKYPAYSCNQICTSKPGSPSGYYWLRGPKDYKDAYAAHMYCEMNMDIPIFGTTQGWMRIANLNMKDRHQHCPTGFHFETHPRRLCSRSAKTPCTSVKFPTHHVQYKRVCGRAVAYQVGSNNAFYRINNKHPATIDGPYLDGISFTHSKSPRKHIWSLAAHWVEKKDDYISQCPCAHDSNRKTHPPSFVGGDYFCETGKYWDKKIDLNDPLWDGEGCGKEERKCCEEEGLPWFCRDLPKATTDDVEVRVCADEGKDNEDLWVEQIQIYVQ